MKSKKVDSKKQVQEKIVEWFYFINDKLEKLTVSFFKHFEKTQFLASLKKILGDLLLTLQAESYTY